METSFKTWDDIVFSHQAEQISKLKNLVEYETET